MSVKLALRTHLEALIPRADHTEGQKFEGDQIGGADYQKIRVEITGVTLSYSSVIIEDPQELAAILASKHEYITDVPIYVSVSLAGGRMEETKVRTSNAT